MIPDPDSPDFTATALGEGTPERLRAFQQTLAENPELRREAEQTRRAALLLGAALKGNTRRADAPPIRPLPRPVPRTVHRLAPPSKPRRAENRRLLRQVPPLASAAALLALLLGAAQWLSLSRDLPETTAKAPAVRILPVLNDPAELSGARPSGHSGVLPSTRSSTVPPAVLPPPAPAELPSGGWASGPARPPVPLSAPAPGIRLQALSVPAPAAPGPPEAAAPSPRQYASPAPGP